MGFRKKTLKRLGSYLMRYRWLLLLAVFMTLASNILALMGPMLSGYAIDAIEPGPGRVDFQKVFYYAAWMAGFYAASAMLSYAIAGMYLTGFWPFRWAILIFIKQGILSAGFPMILIPLMNLCPATWCR